MSSELTRYLEEGWTPVIESDIDGPNALPLRLDRENPNLGRYSATRRVARTIYLGSAPIQQAANRGIDDRTIKLGCVQPGETPATFGDALRRLTDQATYLYVDGQRYWYSLQPSVTRLARDRAVSHFSDDDVEEEIRHWLAAATRPAQRGDFANVHPAPRTPGDVPDDAEVRLIVLGSEHPHSGKTTDSPARVSAQRFLDERAAGARMHRNMLVFLAPDKTRLAELRLAVRDYLAWKSIEAEVQTLNLDNFQRKQAETKRRQFHDAVAQRLGETFIWALTPSQTTTDPTIVWEETRVSGSDPLAVRVSKKLRTEEGLITAYSGVRLRMDLDRVPLWRGDHVALKQLWMTIANTCTYHGSAIRPYSSTPSASAWRCSPGTPTRSATRAPSTREPAATPVSRQANTPPWSLTTSQCSSNQMSRRDRSTTIALPRPAPTRCQGPLGSTQPTRRRRRHGQAVSSSRPRNQSCQRASMAE